MLGKSTVLPDIGRLTSKQLALAQAFFRHRRMAIPAAGFERSTVIAFRDDLERRLLAMSLGAP